LRFGADPGGEAAARDELHRVKGPAVVFADLVNLHAVLDSWGLGTGIGSTRSSSFLVTYFACTGLPGLVCLGAFFFTLVARGWRSDSADVRAMALGLIGLTLAWLISIPDLTLAMVWLLAGVLRGATITGHSPLLRQAKSELRPCLVRPGLAAMATQTIPRS